ncbi:hypothetical protein Tco_0626959 [Tanacetum coccineum]|uniref:Uncharacterized protein n=1 Tax=Tanacetum coccineum TaxID=301880 RepID=A0ABQ4WL02_9ASTR
MLQLLMPKMTIAYRHRLQIKERGAQDELEISIVVLMSWDLDPKENGYAIGCFLCWLSLLGLTTANRQCSSVLQAVVDVAASIKPGSSNGGYIKKCFTALWHDEEGTRPGCSLLTVYDSGASKANIPFFQDGLL